MVLLPSRSALPLPELIDECSMQRQVAADFWTKPISLNQKDLPIGSYRDYITITVYYYTGRKLLLSLPSHSR